MRAGALGGKLLGAGGGGLVLLYCCEEVRENLELAVPAEPVQTLHFDSQGARVLSLGDD